MKIASKLYYNYVKIALYISKKEKKRTISSLRSPKKQILSKETPIRLGRFCRILSSFRPIGRSSANKRVSCVRIRRELACCAMNSRKR